MKIDRYVAVEVRAFGRGMQKLFEGVSEVFSAIGADEPERLELEKAKWKKNGTGDVPATDAPEESTEVDTAAEDSGAAQAENSTDDSADIPVVANADSQAEEKPVKKSTEATTITQDDITKIILRKIKNDRSNNEKIGKLLQNYGVKAVSDLPTEKYEAFLTDIAAI